MSAATSTSMVEQGVRAVLAETLQIGARVDGFAHSTPLLGSVAELDSMAVASVLAALEEAFDIFIDDEDITAEDFETFGSLCRFIDDKTD